MFNKKFYLVGMTVLLSVSLFVVGCEQDPEIEYVDRWHEAEPGDNPGGGGETPAAPPASVVHYDVLVDNEADLQKAFDNPDVAVVGFWRAGAAYELGGSAPLTISKPLYLFSPVFSRYHKIQVESPVYVYQYGALDVSNGVIVRDAAPPAPAPAESVIMRNEIGYEAAKGSLYVFQGGALTVADAESVNDGSPVTILGSDKVQIYGKLKIDAASGPKVLAAVSYVQDHAQLEVDASGISPSKALADILTADSVATKKLAITANAPETEAALTIRQEVSLSTSSTLDTVAALTVNGGTLTAPAAVGASGGLTIVVGENAVVDFGSAADSAIKEIKDGSSVAAGGSLSVGNVTTITAIDVNGGMFEAGDVTAITAIGVVGGVFSAGRVGTITALTLDGASTLEIAKVTTITNAITVPAGATVNGFTYGAGGSITAAAEIDTPPTAALGGMTVASGKTFTVKGTENSESAGDNALELTGAATVDGTIIVPSGQYLSVPEGAANILTVSAGGVIRAAGTFTVAGAIVNNGTIEVSGAFSVKNGASYTGTGTIVVKNGGVAASNIVTLVEEDEGVTPVPADIFGGLSGTVTVESGGTFTYESDDGDESAAPIALVGVTSGDAEPYFSSKGPITLDAATKSITITGAVSLGQAGSGSLTTLSIERGVSLVIAKDATLTLAGAAESAVESLAIAGGDFDIKAGGTLELSAYATLTIGKEDLGAIKAGRIDVAPNGVITVGEKDLVGASGARFAWDSQAANFIVDFATKAIISGSDAFVGADGTEGATALSVFGLDGWTEYTTEGTLAENDQAT
jgi:hypothetical protein